MRGLGRPSFVHARAAALLLSAAAATAATTGCSAVGAERAPTEGDRAGASLQAEHERADASTTREAAQHRGTGASGRVLAGSGGEPLPPASEGPYSEQPYTRIPESGAPRVDLPPHDPATAPAAAGSPAASNGRPRLVAVGFVEDGLLVLESGGRLERVRASLDRDDGAIQLEALDAPPLPRDAHALGLDDLARAARVQRCDYLLLIECAAARSSGSARMVHTLLVSAVDARVLASSVLQEDPRGATPLDVRVLLCARRDPESG